MTRRSLLVALISATAASLTGATKEPNRSADPELLDLNLASRAALEALPGVGPERARLIVAIRERNGAFRCVEELRIIPRLTEKQLAKLKELVHVKGDQVRECDAPHESQR